MGYQWLSNTATLTGQTATNLVFSNAQPNVSASYTVLVTNAAGAVTSTAVVLDVVYETVSVAQFPPGPTNYTGQTITFTASAAGLGTLTYQWLSNSAKLAGQTGTTLVLSDAQPNYSATYAVAVSNTYGAVTSAPVALIVSAAPPQFSSAVLGLNPVVYYHLNDTNPVPGSLWTNWGTAGLAGTMFALNTPAFQQPGPLAGEFSYSAAFNGSSMYGMTPFSPAIDPSKGNANAPFTVELWLNPNNATLSLGSPISFYNGGAASVNISGWELFQAWEAVGSADFMAPMGPAAITPG